MPVLNNVWRKVYMAIALASWKLLLGLFLAHMISSWLMMSYLNENDLTSSFVTWFYYYMVTATTVGYGDLSPSTDQGRLLTSLFVLPGAIAMFTVILGKAISELGSFWKGKLMGKGDYAKRTGHVIIVGWQGEKTRRLIGGIIHERTPDQANPVLMCGTITENPMPDEIDFIKVETLSDVEGLAKAGTAGAKSIIVRGNNDDETLAATVAVISKSSNAQIIAYFEEDKVANLVKGMTPRLEATVSVANDILVRAAYDPGTSAISRLLFSGANPDTAYMMEIPPEAPEINFVSLMILLKKISNVTLIGVRSSDKQEPDLNCGDTRIVKAGDIIYYIGDFRINSAEIPWGSLNAMSE